MLDLLSRMEVVMTTEQQPLQRTRQRLIGTQQRQELTETMQSTPGLRRVFFKNCLSFEEMKRENLFFSLIHIYC